KNYGHLESAQNPHLQERQQMTKKRWSLIAILCCLMLLSSSSLLGQVTANASLQGTVIDKTQAVIGNKAEVTLTNTATGTARTTKTNDAGEYRFESLQAGIYTLKVTAPGFSSAEVKDLEILVGRT